MLENTASLINAGGATFDLTDNGSVGQAGGGTLTNAGTLEKTGGTGTSTIATTTFSNTGTVELDGGRLDISAAVTQVVGKTLTAGTWTVTGSSTATLDITSARRLTTLGTTTAVTLSGVGATFDNLSGLTTIEKGASLSLLSGNSFTTTGRLTNKGILTLSPASILTVRGSFTQTATGTLNVQMDGPHTSPQLGHVVSTTGTVVLGGRLNVTFVGPPLIAYRPPAVGRSFELLDNEGGSAVSGIFKGLPAGSTFKVKGGKKTMVFQITYVGTDTDGNQNVLITRIK
jgi:hypothetical protein